MGIKFSDKIYAATEDKVLADAIQIAGGYMAITEEQKDNLTSAQKVNGTLVYITNGANKGKTFRYNSEIADWEEFIAEVDLTTIEDKVANNEAAINTLNGDSETAGSVDKKIKDAISDLELNSEYVINESPIAFSEEANELIIKNISPNPHTITVYNCNDSNESVVGEVVVAQNKNLWVNPTSDSNYAYEYTLDLTAPESGNYTLSCKFPSGTDYFAREVLNKTRDNYPLVNGDAVNVNPNTTMSYLLEGIEKGDQLHIYLSSDDEFTEIQVEFGEEVTDYVPGVRSEVAFSNNEFLHIPASSCTMYIYSENVSIKASYLKDIGMNFPIVSELLPGLVDPKLLANMFTKRNAVARGTDLNTIDIPGYYHIPSSITDYINNLPESATGGGLLLVFNDLDYNYAEYNNIRHRLYQLLINHPNGDTYIRMAKYNENATSYLDNLGEWIKISSRNVVEFKGTLNTTDLNLVTNPGIYFVSSFGGDTSDETDINNILNFPASAGYGGGTLFVINDLSYSSTLTRLYQIYMNRGGKCFHRYSYQTTDEQTQERSYGFSEWANMNSDIYETVDIPFYPYLKFKSGNLFNGNYISNYRIAGVPESDANPVGLTLQYTDESYGFNSLAILRVHPNTEYSAIISDSILEHGPHIDADKDYYYFAVATATKLLSPDEQFDGSIEIKKTSTKTLSHTFTTGADDRYLYVQTSMNYHPFLQVVEGAQTELTVFEGDANCYKAKYTFDSDLIDIDVDTDNSGTVAGKCLIEPTNLFHGEYLPEHVRIGGSGKNQLQYNADHGSDTFKIEVEPNTNYSVILDSEHFGFENPKDTDKTNLYNYFKVATATKDLGIPTKSSGNIDFDGAISLQSTQALLTNYNFTTGANDKFLYVQTSRKLHPFVQVVKNSDSSNIQKTLSTHSYNEYRIITSDGKSVLVDKEPNKTGYSFYKYWPTKNIKDSQIFIKDWEHRVVYNFRRCVNSEIGLDTYRWYELTLDGDAVFTNSDCEGVIKEVGAADFIGGFHGDEKYKDITIIVDGEVIGDYQPATKENCKNITIIVNSEVYDVDTGAACTVGNDQQLFNRTKKLVWEDHKLTVYNKWEYVGNDDFSVGRSALGGLFSCYKTLLNGYSTNHDYKYHVSVPKNGDTSTDLSGHHTDMNEGTFYCNNGMTLTLRSFANTADNKYYHASVCNFEDQNRYKFYFDDLNSSSAGGTKVLKTGDTLNRKFEIQVTAN